MSYGVGCRCGSDLVLLRLWLQPAAVAPIQPLAQELPNSVGVVLKSKKKKKKKKGNGERKSSQRSELQAVVIYFMEGEVAYAKSIWTHRQSQMAWPTGQGPGR